MSDGGSAGGDTTAKAMGLAIERRTAHQLVLDTLRRAILTGRISAGTRLVQAEIADQLQVSTTPVREALRDLATEGLIRLTAHRGAEVKCLDYEEAAEIHRLRRILEPEVMRRAVERITVTELSVAGEICARAEASCDTAAWVEADHDFHGVFVHAARSPRLEAIMQGLHDAAGMYIAATLESRPGGRREANREHRRIVAATRGRDAARAIELVLAHIRQTMRAVAHQLGARGARRR